MEPDFLGYNQQLEQFRIENNLTGFEVGRVVAEHRERYVVKTDKGDLEAEITGNLRFSAKSREDFPAVGDWVAITIFEPDFSVIHQVFPRSSVIARQAAGQQGEIQIIAANIDCALLVQAVDRDFNINRFERYLTICHAAKVKPVIVLTKTDLITSGEIDAIKQAVGQRIQGVQVLAVSNQTGAGYDELLAKIEKGKTYCLLGSSGVGKSTLTNRLSGKDLMKTDAISQSTSKGRHVTSHRELIVLENGGILIDNPGMREVGIADTSDGLETTFNQIVELARTCRYADCTHTAEKGCAVREALNDGTLDPKTYENYQKMEREKAHFESTVSERRKKEKELGKVLKEYNKKYRDI